MTSGGMYDDERKKRLGVMLATGLIVGESSYGVLAVNVSTTGKEEPLAMVGDLTVCLQPLGANVPCRPPRCYWRNAGQHVPPPAGHGSSATARLGNRARPEGSGFSQQPRLTSTLLALRGSLEVTKPAARWCRAAGQKRRTKTNQDSLCSVVTV